MNLILAFVQKTIYQSTVLPFTKSDIARCFLVVLFKSLSRKYCK